MIAAYVLLAFLPVCLFLASLVYIDSYQLVPLRRLARITAMGGLAAIAGYTIHRLLLQRLGVDPRALTLFVAPAIEETLKLLPVLWLLRRKKIGFVIDAAICGFALGAGFAVIENLYYLAVLPPRSVGFWVVRGFGTAVMHGGTTSIAAMMIKVAFDSREQEKLRYVFPALLSAFLIHSLFNRFILSPLASALAVTIILPPLMAFVFAQSERYLQAWLGNGFDIDTELLQAVRSGAFTESRAGRYLQALRDHFEGPVVADMLCYLRLSAELSLRAKGILMLRENGLPVQKDAQTAAKLAELQYLKSSIGRTGLLALAPILHRKSHDIWQLQLLESDG